jgi:hypothetical protein
MTFGSPNSGLSVVGSDEKTSMAAPAMTPCAAASARSASLTMPPLHQPQALRVEQVDRVGGLGQMHGDEVRPLEDLVDGRHELDTEPRGTVRGDEGVIGDQAHPERVAALRDESSDPSESEHPQRLVLQFGAGPG